MEYLTLKKIWLPRKQLYWYAISLLLETYKLYYSMSFWHYNPHTFFKSSKIYNFKKSYQDPTLIVRETICDNFWTLQIFWKLLKSNLLGPTFNLSKSSRRVSSSSNTLSKFLNFSLVTVSADSYSFISISVSSPSIKLLNLQSQ